MATLFDLVSEVHRLSGRSSLSVREGKLLSSFWVKIDAVLGLLCPEKKNLPDVIRGKVLARITARVEKKFAVSDEIRDSLAAEGYQLEDSREGTIVIWAEGREIVK